MAAAAGPGGPRPAGRRRLPGPGSGGSRTPAATMAARSRASWPSTDRSWTWPPLMRVRVRSVRWALRGSSGWSTTWAVDAPGVRTSDDDGGGRRLPEAQRPHAGASSDRWRGATRCADWPAVALSADRAGPVARPAGGGRRAAGRVAEPPGRRAGPAPGRHGQVVNVQSNCPLTCSRRTPFGSGWSTPAPACSYCPASWPTRKPNSVGWTDGLDSGKLRPSCWPEPVSVWPLTIRSSSERLPGQTTDPRSGGGYW
jgi:hypothetical protein